MVVYELALVHELIEFMTVYEQLMLMNKVGVYEQNKFMISWASWKSHLLFKNIHKPFMNTLMNVHERSWFFVHEHSRNIHECSWTVHNHLTGDYIILILQFDLEFYLEITMKKIDNEAH